MSVSSLLSSTLALPACSALSTLPLSGRIAWMSRSRPCLAEPPALSPSTMNSSDSSGLVLSQSWSLPGRFSRLLIAVFRRTCEAAARLASRALAAWITRWAIASPTLLFLIRKFSSRGRTIDSTSARTSGLFSRPLVCPWNCGSRTQTESTAVSPSRMSSPLISIPFLIRSCVVHEPEDGRLDRLAHPLLVGAAVAGRDRVDERADVLVGRLGPGQREVAAEALVGVLALQHERARRRPACRPARLVRSRRGSRRRRRRGGTRRWSCSSGRRTGSTSPLLR